MKTLAFLFLAVFVSVARAGGPGAQMNDARVEAVEKTTDGSWFAVVSGAIEIYGVDASDPTRGATTKLYVDRAKIKVVAGNQLYALSGPGLVAYEKRLKNAVGQKMVIQMWGPILVIEGGRVVEITAGDISLFRPRKGEAAFDLDRLNEIQSK